MGTLCSTRVAMFVTVGVEICALELYVFQTVNDGSVQRRETSYGKPKEGGHIEQFLGKFSNILLLMCLKLGISVTSIFHSADQTMQRATSTIMSMIVGPLFEVAG
jgi:hypothetical protein